MLNRLFRWKSARNAITNQRETSIQNADQLIQAGQRLEDRGELEAALALYQDAVIVAPQYWRAYMNSGNALRQLQRWEEAEGAHRKAVECAADYAPARFNLGQLLIDMGNVAEAEEQLLAAIRLQPTLVEAPIVLAELYETLDRLDEAEMQFVKALAINPTHQGAMLNFGIFCLGQGRLDQASLLFQKVNTMQPGFKDAESSVLFALNFRTDVDPCTIADRHRAVGTLISLGAKQRATAWLNTVEPERPLRVGYMSGDFFLHPVALFLRPILEHHNPESTETYCYSNYEQGNPTGESLRARSNHWLNISGMSDERVIEQIRQDKIDILVDLSGHTNRNRLSVFAHHPAPVQMTWLGYLNTTGLDAMDYRICDTHTDPPGLVEKLYTETLIRMPHSQWCYVPWHPAERIPQPHRDRPGAIIFGSFNQVAKISDVCLKVWSNILRAVPHAQLVVLDVRQPLIRRRLLERAAQNGVNPDRLVLHGRESIPLYYSAIGESDIALDTFPYNGATTTLDALWMGVPVVALRGDRSISRSSYSILRTLGADDLIADSIEEYIELNVRLATDSRWRQHLRRTLRERLEASALMDAPRFVAALEERFRKVWRAWCESRQTNVS